MIKKPKFLGDRSRVRYVSVLGAILPFSLAMAQTTEVAGPVDGMNKLETVTVTAERRTENIKDVPESVSILRGEKLDVLMSGGQDIRVLAAKVPSLNVEASSGRTVPRFYIRGYGNTDFSPFASQPVSLIYDDVVQENGYLKGFPVFDMAGVEVLRGPQGTLFGRNTPAGLVKFDSAKPKPGVTEGYYSISDGTHNTANLEGAVNIPLSEQWTARFSTLVQHRNDYVKNTEGEKDKLEGYDEAAARLQFLYKPNTAFDALFNAHSRALNGTARLFRANIFQKGSNDFTSTFDPYSIGINGQNRQMLRTSGASMRLNWTLDDIQLHAITGFETVNKYFSRSDIDGGTPAGPGFIPFQVQTSAALVDHKQWSQEFRVESKNKSALNWQAGVYYFYENAAANASNYSSTTQLLTGYQVNRQTNNAAAAFGSLTYDLTDRLQVRSGLRYTNDHKNFGVEQTQNVIITGPRSMESSANNKSWDTSATYKLTPDVNIYTRVATGFRAPSFGPPSAAVPITLAKAETILSYEMGLKADLFERRARANFSIYDFDVKNQQLTAVGGSSNATQLINAAKTVGRGAELDLEALVTENLRMTMGASYNFTQIRDSNLGVAGCGLGATLCTMQDPKLANGTYSINGNPLPQAPRVIYNLTARYSIPMANDDEYFIFTDWAYRSKVNFFLYQAAEFTGKPLTEGGLRVGYNWHGRKYEVAAYARNITNKIVAVGAIDFNNLTGFINEPRMFGLQFKADF